MNGNRLVRMTVEFELDEETLQTHGLKAEDVFPYIVLSNDDFIDGFHITTDIPNIDRTWNFFLFNSRIISKELVPAKTIEFKELEEMVREELRQHGTDVYGLDEREARALIHHDESISLLANEAKRYLSDAGVTAADAINYAFTTTFQNVLENFRDEFTISVVRAGEHTFQDIRFYDLEKGDLVIDRSGEVHIAAIDAVPEKDYVVGTNYLYLGTDNLTSGIQGSLYEVPCTVSAKNLRDYIGTAYYNPETGDMYNLSCNGLQRGELYSFLNMGQGTLIYNGREIPFCQNEQGKRYVDLILLNQNPDPSRLADRIGVAKERQGNPQNTPVVSDKSFERQDHEK